MTTAQRLLAAFWIAAGTNHFVRPRAYESIVPDYLPAHRELVLWSGVAEIVGGLAVLSRRTRNPFARWWIIGVLAAVYPANVHMALNPERYEGIPRAALWARLPLQFLAAWWAWKATAADRDGASASPAAQKPSSSPCLSRYCSRFSSTSST